MQKIISLFQRNYDGDRLVRDEVVPGAEWVIEGEGVATVKIDGTSCLVQDGKLWKRYDAKKGKTPPADFVPAQDDPDPVTGHWPGWLPVGDGPEDRWHREADENEQLPYIDGTYELVGPKVQGNPYGLTTHELWQHGKHSLPNGPVAVYGANPLTFDAIRHYLASCEPAIEGIVWHHPDGRMVKIKAKDFGIKWPR